ncbi:hypothetical protein L915_03809, partial [Phytophthora nicotianae]
MAMLASYDTTNPMLAPMKKPLADLNITNPLASVVHQADRNGKQQPILTGVRRVSREGSIGKKTQQR